MNKKTLIKIIAVVVVIAVLISVLAIINNMNKSIIETETINVQTVADSIYTNSYIERNETLIKNDSDGYVSYVFEDGGKIGVGGVVANIYKTEKDALANKDIIRLDKEIKNYEKLNMTSISVSIGLDTINNQINEKIINLNKSINRGEYYTIEQEKDELLYLINERQIVIGDVVNFNSKIKELKKQKEELENSCNDKIGEITSPVAGYFISSTDGFEGDYDYKKCKDMSSKTLNKLLKSERHSNPENVVGKVISELNWFINCPVTAQEAIKINSNNYDDIKVYMPYATTRALPVEVVAVNQKDDKSDGVLVLECKNMSNELANLRKETVQIDINTYTGFAIKKSALHEETINVSIKDKNGNEKTEPKKIKGVYTVKGRELTFKEVDILYAINDIYICNSSKNSKEYLTGETVELYDKVVVEGYDLYNGKIVNA